MQEEKLSTKETQSGKTDDKSKPRKLGSAIDGTLSDPRPIDDATFNLPTARVNGEGISSKSS